MIYVVVLYTFDGIPIVSSFTEIEFVDSYLSQFNYRRRPNPTNPVGISWLVSRGLCLVALRIRELSMPLYSTRENDRNVRDQ